MLRFPHSSRIRISCIDFTEHDLWLRHLRGIHADANYADRDNGTLSTEDNVGAASNAG